MARKDVVVSALEALTSKEFEPSDFADNSGLRVLIAEYFAGGNEGTDDNSSDEEIGKFSDSVNINQ